MNTDIIYKYTVPFDREGIWVPEGQIVLVDSQDGATVCVWVLHNIAERAEQQLKIIGTGQMLEVAYDHVGSVVVKPFVWHVFRTGSRVIGGVTRG